MKAAIDDAAQHLPPARTTEAAADRQPKPEPVATEAAPRCLSPSAQQPPSAHPHRPGRVVGIDGIVFQCDADDPISSLFIRPIEELSVRFRGRSRRAESLGVPLANHAGIPEPAAPRFKSNARLSPRARYLLRVDELPSIHEAVEAARAPEPARGGVTGDQALQRLTDQKRAPARVLFWFLAQLGRA
jgi:hypothetical protein